MVNGFMNMPTMNNYAVNPYFTSRFDASTAFGNSGLYNSNSNFVFNNPYANAVPIQTKSLNDFSIDGDSFKTPNMSSAMTIDKEENKSSSMKKILMGAGIIAGAIGMGALLFKGEFNQAKQLAEKIEFIPAKTLEEAKIFAKNHLNIKKVEFDNVEIANYVNEGLVKLNNSTKGKTIMPRVILTKDKIVGGGCEAMMAAYKSDLYLSRKEMNKIMSFCKSNNRSVKEFFEGYGKYISKSYEFGPYQTLYHEIGHMEHRASMGGDFLRKCSSLQELKSRGISDSSITTEFLNNNESNRIASSISEYALTSPAEFVADVYSLLAQGQKLPVDVMELYGKYTIR